jgi:hypothetical protein
MVSKQEKYLRQQAVLRAEKYKDEQKRNVAARTSTTTTSTSTHGISRFTFADNN